MSEDNASHWQEAFVPLGGQKTTQRKVEHVRWKCKNCRRPS